MQGDMIGRWIALLILACGLFALPALAQTNPFTGAPQREQAAPQQSREPAKAGLLARATREILQWQRRMNVALAKQMRAIRDGEGWSAVFGSLFAGVGLAFLYGALHVAGPGHGKAVIVSYFLGRDAKLIRGLWLGLQIAATHVAAAIVIVWLADAALRQAFGGAPAELRAVQAVSYGVILLIGLHMLWQAVRRLAGRATTDLCEHGHHGHGLKRDHDHEQGHDHDRERGQERARQGFLSIAVGMVPCTGATLVMFYALANGIIAAGVVMVVGIGLGMAVAMAVIGITTILARRAALARLTVSSGDGGRIGGALQLAASLAIILLGSLMLYGTFTGVPTVL